MNLASSPKQQHRLLIVDDDVDHINLQMECLRREGYLVTGLSSGKAAIELLKQIAFDVIILDVIMPEVDGEMICKYVRCQEKLSLTPIIMMSGDHTAMRIVNCMHAGANDYIIKPYHQNELHRRILSALDHKRLVDQLDNAESLLFALARLVEAKDKTTGNHCTRLSHMAAVFGKKLNLDSDQIRALSQGGILHDIGKLAIPDSILLKPEKLNDAEWALMRQHTVIGECLCSQLNCVKDSIPIIRSHHERWDGGGYPDGLKGDSIPLLAQIFQIVDIYDALTSQRPYKSEFDTNKAVNIMKKEADKGWRDPELLAVFLDIIRTDPGSLCLTIKAPPDLGMVIYKNIEATGILAQDQHTAH